MTKELHDEFDSRFRSANAIPVERATMRREEWERLRLELIRLMNENVLLRHSIAPEQLAAVRGRVDLMHSTALPDFRALLAELYEAGDAGLSTGLAERIERALNRGEDRG